MFSAGVRHLLFVFFCFLSPALSWATITPQVSITTTGETDSTYGSTEVSVFVSLQHDECPTPWVDWWAVSQVDGIFYSFALASGTWQEGMNVTYQGPVTNLPSFQVFQGSLPVGTQTFYFGIDSNVNGVIDADSLVYDYQQIVIAAESVDEETLVSDGTSAHQDLFTDNQKITFSCSSHLNPGIPLESDQYLCRDGYAVGYSYANKTADWVSYYITAESVAQYNERNENFREDEEIPEEYRSTLSDYRFSGYDRGHLAPAATVDFSYESMDESFLLANMTPQIPSFNRGAWASLEEYVRDCAATQGELYVVTGVVSDESGSSYIGDHVLIPTQYYKAIFDPNSLTSMAFLLPHDSISTDELPNYIVSIDELEEETGHDLFPALPDDLESSIETNLTPICELPWNNLPETEPDTGYSCSSKYCGQITDCAEAMYLLNTCGLTRLDGDGDGVPCEAICN